MTDSAESVMTDSAESVMRIQVQQFRRAAGSPKDAYLRSLLLINVGLHGHTKVYLKINFVS